MEGLSSTYQRAPSLDELWAWAAREAESLKTRYGTPLRLHAQTGDRDDWGDVLDEAIRGLPFTRRFEAYLDERISADEPVVIALRFLKPMRTDPQAKHLMYEVARGALAGSGQAGTLAKARKRIRGRVSEFAFNVAALHGLSAVYFKAEALYQLERRAA